MAARRTQKNAVGGTRRKSSASKTTRTKKKNNGNATLVLFIIAFVFLVVLCLANFNLIGVVGQGIKWFFFGLIGVMSYVFPFLIAFNLIWHASYRKTGIRAHGKFVCAYIFMVLLSAFIQRAYSLPDIRTASIPDFFFNSANNKLGGGIAGGIIDKLLSPTATVGTMIILIIGMAILIIIMTARSLSGRLERMGEERGFSGTGHKKNDKDNIYRTQERENMRAARQEELARIDRLKAEREQAGEQKERARLQHMEARNERRERQKELAHERRMRALEREKEILRQREEKRKLRGSAVSAHQQNQEKNHFFDDRTQADIDDFYEAERVNGGLRQKSQKNNFDFEKNDNAQIKNDFDSELNSEILNDDNPDFNKSVYEKSDDRPVIRRGRTKRDDSYEKSNSGFNIKEDSKSKREQVKQDFSSNSDEKRHSEGKSSDGKSLGVQPKGNNSGYKYPPLELLTDSSVRGSGEEDVSETAIILEDTLRHFGVNAKVINYSCGPTVTRYELEPEIGTKVSKIKNLSDEIKMNLAADDIRIEAPIPGKRAVGIEVPNRQKGSVSFKSVIDNDMFRTQKSLISCALGVDITGKPVMADISKMPHALIAGATGSGKSVCVNTIIMSILFRARPDEVKMIMIDPKKVEFSAYNGIPHLLIPVVTDAKKASGALNWACAEMDARYKKFAEIGVKKIDDYNAKVKKMNDPEWGTMPKLIIVIDELADLMIVASAEVETAIERLTQLARAAGIHLIIATQRPSVDVITGVIKGNIPTRIALKVAQGVDSKTIIDTIGAEKLLGYGDMLFSTTGMSKPQRIQGAYLDESEIEAVVEFLKEQFDDTDDDKDDEEMEAREAEITAALPTFPGASVNGFDGDERDQLFEEAGRYLIEKDKASIGALQRQFRLGFNRAARIMDQLTSAGVVGPELGTKPRDIKMTPEEFEEFIKQ